MSEENKQGKRSDDGGEEEKWKRKLRTLFHLTKRHGSMWLVDQKRIRKAESEDRERERERIYCTVRQWSNETEKQNRFGRN